MQIKETLYQVITRHRTDNYIHHQISLLNKGHLVILTDPVEGKYQYLAH
jgi:hypothetical protein